MDIVARTREDPLRLKAEGLARIPRTHWRKARATINPGAIPNRDRPSERAMAGRHSTVPKYDHSSATANLIRLSETAKPGNHSTAAGPVMVNRDSHSMRVIPGRCSATATRIRRSERAIPARPSMITSHRTRCSGGDINNREGLAATSRAAIATCRCV